MENKGLIFIPDISGYTQFINEMEIEHSLLVIKELLETIINANESGLVVSEIEGDAILFYKFDEVPDLKELYKQVERMFCDFQRNVIAYDQRRFCQCKACSSAINLTLKIITHYGEFTGYRVNNFNKLIGKDVIVAHRLLKNDIANHEYWLVTKSLLMNNAPVNFEDWMKWDKGAAQTESGEVDFEYTQLGPLKNHIRPYPLPLQDLSQKVRMISVTREYDTDIITLFHAAGDFSYRGRWMEGVKAVEEVGHFLPRVGMRCKCITNSGEETIYSTNYSYHSERIEFSETDENKKSSTHYLLEKKGDNKVKLTIDYYLRKNIFNEIIFKLTKKKKMEDMFNKSLLNLTDLVKEIKLPISNEVKS